MTAVQRSIVVPHRAGYKYRLLGFALLTGLLATAFGYWLGVEDLAEMSAEHEQLKAQLKVVEGQYAESRGQLEILRVNREVDLAAIENSRQEIIAVQQQNIKNQQELALYRELLGDTGQAKGLSVTGLSLRSLGGQRFSYRWVARQKTVKMARSKVLATVFVMGVLDGEDVTLSLDQIDDELDDMPLNLTLKYFSINQGVLSLPDGFNPVKVGIKMRYSWEKNYSYDQIFDWKIED